MSISKDRLRKQMEESLSTRFGGSLLLEKTKLTQSCVTVFIGLGGLGGRAVNAIKGATREKVDGEDRRFFLVVDTCRQDMNKISVATAQDLQTDETEEKHHGFIEAEEKMTLYSDSFKISTLGKDVNAWLDRAAFDDRNVDDKGAQGVRQIGRVMLVGKPGKYSERYKLVREVLVKARDKAAAEKVPMKVYIVAGIGGGTGSGTVVDFSYMVRKAMADFALDYQFVEGVLFTPDVQKNDDGMSDTYYESLCVNFYAAIKEIDYFFNNSARKKAYVCPVGAQVDAYKKDIFDQCTIVSSHASGISMVRNSDELVLQFANAIAFELGGIEGVKPDGNTQSYDAFYSNIHTEFRYWFPKNSGGKGVNVPDFFPHRYSSLGYSSFYVPRDELTAYCANKLVEKMVEDWTEKDIKKAEIEQHLRKYGLISTRTFAGRLFTLAECADKFDVEKRELPRDGSGPLPVRNCTSYLELMHSIAVGESSKPNLIQLLKIAGNKIPESIVKPIVSTVDKAFTAPDGRGPVYAINLLSADQIDRTGILPHIRNMLSSISDDAKAWELELSQVYAQLQKIADEFDGKLSIEAESLQTYTDNCRKYGEDLLRVALLKQAYDTLLEIYKTLNNENNKLFEIYTTTFDFLKNMLRKDGEYVLNTNRHRDGHTTVFTFDMASFLGNDVKSERFKRFFEQFVDNEDLDKQAGTFINQIFGRLKNLLAPVDSARVEFTEKDVIDILRDYFNTAFASWTSDVLENFCIMAYSDVDISPANLTEIRKDPKLAGVALQAAADAIEAKLVNKSKVLLTSADEGRNIEDFVSFSAVYGLEGTKNINKMFDRTVSTMPGNNWSEFIAYKRIFGFPLQLLADLKTYRELYREQSAARGMHLDEVGDDWRYALPEPYDYNIAQFLETYERGGGDVTEADRIRMKEIRDLAQKAKELGILIVTADGDRMADVNGEDSVQNPMEWTEEDRQYYRLVPSLLQEIDVDAHREQIHEKLKAKLLEKNTEISLVELLTEAGYELGKPVDIKWKFAYNEYSVMKNRTDFGTDTVFGNFITLVRSNYEWEKLLKDGVNLFSKLQAIYEAIKNEMNSARAYDEKITDFLRAVRVGRIVPFSVNGLFTGYKLRIDDKIENDQVFVNNGLDAFDQLFLMYNCFVEDYLKLDAGSMTRMNTLVNHAFDDRVDYNEESRENVQWFITEAERVLADADYLAHYDAATKEENFRKELKTSKYEYTLPTPSERKTNVAAVIKNLKSFYIEVRDYLKKNLPKLAAPTQSAVPATGNDRSQQAAGGWTCSCGITNVGNFCMNCGGKKPQETADGWTCSCGTVNTGNFCMSCGSKKPETGNWFCPDCGTANTGNFCTKCGQPKGGRAVVCSNCGWKPLDGQKPAFCPQCGTKMG